MSMPKEPRQMMINMMYLVLTAMLALNVSSEILHAFKTINKSILQSNSSIVDKNTQIYDALDKLESDPATAENVKPFNDKAKLVKSRTIALVDYLEDLKTRIIAYSGGYVDSTGGELKGESDIDAATHLLVEKKGGDTLQAKINDTRDFMLDAVNPDVRASIGSQMPLSIVEAERTENNPGGDWNEAYFHNMPVMAAVTLLSKFQNDARNSEALVLNELAREAGDTKISFDELMPIAVPKNSYALAGQKVEATILLAAYNKKVNPSVTKSSGTINKIENGVAYWETVASGVGLQTVKGQISIDLGGGKTVTKPYSFEYTVGSEGASMQLDKMNVFYIGVENPVTISAAGYSLEDVSLSFPDGEVKAGESKGHYMVTATKPTEQGAKVAVIARTQGGGSKEVSAMMVRVKQIPNPVAKVAQKAGGYVRANVFRPQVGVQADLENFVFDLRYTVTEFEYRALKKGDPDIKGPYKVKGPVWSGNGDIMRIQNDLKPGDRVFIDEIKAIGPDKKRRDLNPLSFTLI